MGNKTPLEQYCHMGCRSIILFFFVLSSVQTLKAEFDIEGTRLYVSKYAQEIQNTDDLQDKYESLLSSKKPCDNSLLQIQYYLGLSHMYNNNSELALPFLHAVEACLVDAQESNAFSHVLFALGNAFSSINKFEESISYYDQCLELLSKNDAEPFYYDVIENYEIVLSKVGEYAKAEKLLKMAISENPSEAHMDKYLSLVLLLAENYNSVGKLDSALYYYNKILLHKPLLSATELISLYSTVGNLYNQKGNYLTSQNYFIDALEMSELEKDSFFIMSLSTDVSKLYEKQSQWDKVIQYSSLAIEIAEKKSIPFVKANNLRAQGLAYSKLDSASVSIDKYNRALIIFKQLNQPINIASIQLTIASILKDEEKFMYAKMYLEEAIKLRNPSRDPIGVLQTKLLLSEVEIGLKNYTSAITKLQFCAAESDKMNNLNFLTNSHRLLAEAYEGAGLYERALQNQRKYQQLQDSVLSIERTKVINEIEGKYVLDKELLRKEQQLIQQQHEIDDRNFQVITLSILSIFFLLVSGLLLRLFFKNKQLNMQKLEASNRQKEMERMKAVMEGEENERKRIARELHDDLGAQLAGIKVHVSALQNDIPKITQLAKFNKTENLIDNACKSVRELSHNMMPSSLDEQPLDKLLEDLSNGFSLSFNIPIDYQSYNLPTKLSKEIKITLYRIVQELFRNIAGHSQATEAILHIAYEQNNIHLIVEDNGVGFNLDRVGFKNGIGLDNILSRVKYLEGHVDIHTAKNLGSTFTIDIPV